MWEGTESITIGAPPEAVWAIIADFRRHAELAGSGEVLTIENISGPLAVGMTFESRNAVKGAGTFTATEEVIEVEPGVSLGWRSAPPPVVKNKPDSVPDITWRYALTPVPGGTEVSHSFRVVEPAVGAGRLRLFYLVTRRERAIRRGMSRTLGNLKEAVEAGGRTEPSGTSSGAEPAL